jgi:hypothetical protein
MKIKHLLIFTLLLCILSGYRTVDENIIYPGFGVNNIKLTENTLEDANTEFGIKKLIKIKHILWHCMSRGRDKFYSYEYQNKELGVLMSGQESKAIDQMIFRHPFKGKTIEGIEIGISSREDIIKCYGKPTLEIEFDLAANKHDKSREKHYNMRDYKHIFWIEGNGKFKLIGYHQIGITFIVLLKSDDFTSTTNLENKLIGIEINTLRL